MENELRQRLIEAEKAGRPLKIYCGYDPRTADLHIGHTVSMRKLRPILTQEQVMENARTYSEQAFRVLDRSKTILRYNHEWLAGLMFADLIKLGSNFTIQQFLKRESFRKRWDAGDAIYLHEYFYAIMQGYDAFALNCDVQVGGTDQMFNIVTAARKIMTALGARPNIGVACAVIVMADSWDGDEAELTAELRAHVQERLARFKQPKVYALVDALPLNPSGKVLKRVLRERFPGPAPE